MWIRSTSLRILIPRLFTVMQNRIRLITLMRIRILLLIKLMRILLRPLVCSPLRSCILNFYATLRGLIFSLQSSLILTSMWISIQLFTLIRIRLDPDLVSQNKAATGCPGESGSGSSTLVADPVQSFYDTKFKKISAKTVKIFLWIGIIYIY